MKEKNFIKTGRETMGLFSFHSGPWGNLMGYVDISHWKDTVLSPGEDKFVPPVAHC